MLPSLKKKYFSSNDISLKWLCKEHLSELARCVRLEDRQEMWAAYRLSALEVLEHCWQKSSVSLAFLYRGKVCAVAGVEADSLLGVRGCVWSWTGKETLRCPKEFWKVSQHILAYFLSLYPQLYALCDRRYLAAQGYLQRLGACPQADGIQLAGKETRFVLYRFSRPSEDLQNK